MPPAAQLLVILLVLVFFWVIVMRPARNQQRRVQQLQHGLEVGQEVVLSSGIFGTIRSLTDGRAELEVKAVSRSSVPSTSKSTSTPRERPIHSSWMRFALRGQSSPRSPCSSWSA